MAKQVPPKKHEAPSHAFPVVGVGASAGGLEAFSQLLHSLPAETGMAFVLVQHLAPQHESILPAILSRSTAMPVRQAEESMPLEPNHVYVIPPGQDMLIHDGRLALRPREPSERPHMPVDLFLRSLAEVRGGQAVAVVLSGTGSDGTMGCKAVKSAGGISFAQEPGSARYDGMPRSAIAAGCVDLVLTPEGIGHEIARLSSDDYLQLTPGAESESSPTEKDKDPFRRILALLNQKCGIDFEAYKKPTLVRRIRRRMALRRIERFPEYLRWLEKNPAEVEILHHDLLINVTTFFRDPGTFEFLATHAFPKILEDRPPDAPVRVWVPGCATGEETYSMAMALLETAGRMDRVPAIQVFGTDVSSKVIDRARAGIYPESIAADVTPERLARFFVKRDGTYQLGKEVRDLCVFAQHNLIEDPPFSRMDLISCRNVLIYLEPEHQKRLLAAFHYALSAEGLLVLGSSETVGALPDRFVTLHKDRRIYAKKPGVPPAPYGILGTYRKPSDRKAVLPRDEGQRDRQREADRILLARYGPPGVLVDDNLDVLQFRGDTSSFLEHSHGEASLNLLRLLPKGQLADVRKTIEEARARDLPCRREMRWGRRGQAARMAVDVIPVHGTPSDKSRSFLVLFDAAPRRRAPAAPAPPLPRARSENAKDRRIAELEQELGATKQYQQALTEEQEAAHEELQSAHEEVMSSNEELQSINEELETAKEELQSVNEEMTTVNDELQSRNKELAAVREDLLNLLDSLNAPIIMVDADLRLRRFTPAAANLFNFIPADAGRPLSDLRPMLAVSDLHAGIQETILRGAVVEREICDFLGRWYLLRIQPYKTKEDRVEGAVLMLLDIDERKRAAARVEQAAAETEAIVQTVRHAMLLLDADLRVKRANRSFYRLFRVTAEQTEGRFIYELGDGQWNVPELRGLLENLLARATVIEDLVVEREFPVIGAHRMILNACRLKVRGSDAGRILVAIEDRTETDEEVRQATASNRLKDEFIATVSHELRGPLNAMSGWVNVLAGNVDQLTRDRGLAALERSVKAQTRLIEDLLDMSRILSGKLRLNHRFVDFGDVAQAALETALPAAQAKSVHVLFQPSPEPLFVMGDPDRLQQVVWNLLSNAVKFTPRDGRVEIRLDRLGTSVRVHVSDTGQGIAAEFLPHVFEPFRQADSSPSRSHQGLGLGLAIVRYLVEAHGGVIRAESAGVSRGSTFTILLPVPALVMETPDAEATTAKRPAALDRFLLAGLRVLIVEDDADSRDILATVLSESGAEVSAAESAMEALAAIEDRPPDAVVSDIGMPEMDGYAFVAELRRRPPDKGGLVPAIALTAYTEPQSRNQAIAAGFQEHLSKPADPQALLAAVARLTNRRPAS